MENVRNKKFLVIACIIAMLGSTTCVLYKMRVRSSLLLLINHEIQEHGAECYVPMTRDSCIVLLDGEAARVKVLPLIELSGFVVESPLVATASDGTSIEVNIKGDIPIRIRFLPDGHTHMHVANGPLQGLWVAKSGSDRKNLERLRDSLGLTWPNQLNNEPQ